MAATKSVLKLIGVPQSTCTTRLLIVFAEKDLEFSLYQPDLANGEQKRKPHTDKHPFGVIPVLEDGDFRIFESRAIARYLAVKYHDRGSPLVPPVGDTKAWALFEQWASVELSHFDPFASVTYVQKFINPKNGTPSDESAVTTAIKILGQKLDVMDGILNKQAYMGGETFSLVDVFYMPTMNGLFLAGEGHLITSRIHLDDWWKRLTARPSWKKVLDAYTQQK
ncbi:hypothetical protein OIDMADRAFT_36174 [Oidiodendron maius Zn]|uniref:glutathione transferase n=1 Tax=Oidiodendron maius (strain Zn) TaxID=913774 RepID=A0A0C3CTA9_OIDMZ|nr:hypothetical protein OIDMADRAFT_36174 [Oidiodendron maius Zn]